MDMSKLAHEIGLLGECLNFVGAFILALDLFLRPRERRRHRKLQELRFFSQKFSLTRTRYRNVDIDSPEFESAVSDQETLQLALVGVIFMALGFLSLIAYHWMEL
jgi:hypothetical protein